MKRKWAPAPEDEHETRAEDSGKYTDNHSRTAKTREWFLSSMSRCLRSKSKSQPASRHHRLRRSHFSLEVVLPLALPYPGHQALYVVFLLLPGCLVHADRKSHIQRTSTIPTPSPRKLARIPSNTLSRPGSPTKPTASSLARQVRVPSASTFKPAIPKTPAYPPRWPRRDESMLSVNGSPLANPYELGLEWLAEDGTAEGSGAPSRPALRRTASNIVIRRDPSFVAAGSNTPGNLNHQTKHSRSDSQSQNHQPHSRSNSRPGGIAPTNSGQMAARVAVPTRDGHLLEFDPLLTSPGALDKLEGITDSAKKQAKEDMSRLVKAAVAKWNVK